MGVIVCPAGATARTASISAVQSATGNLGARFRVRVDEIMALTTGTFKSAGLGQYDDGTDSNVKMKFFVADNNGPKQVGFLVPTQGGYTISAAASGGGWVSGANRYAVIVIGYFGGNVHVAVYDDTGTGTLIDGLAPGSSAWYHDAPYSMTIPVVTGMGQFVLSHASNPNGAQQVQLLYDSVMLLKALPTLDALPASNSANINGGWEFDDAPGTAPQTYASYMTGGADPVIIGSTTPAPSLAGGGAEAAYTQTPTTVTGTPSAPSVAVGATVQLVPETDDLYGVAMTGRTYSYSSADPSKVSVNSSGLCTGVATTAGVNITVHDTAGGSPTDWVVAVACTSGAPVDDWVSSDPTKASTGTGLATELITAVATGNATITVTRHGSSISCTVAVVVGGSGTGNEPSGMTTKINTGAMTNAPAKSSVSGSNTWTQGSSIVSTFTNFTNMGQAPDHGLPVGVDMSRIQLAPDGSGTEVIYDTAATAPLGVGLMAGYNAVSWFTPIGLPPSGNLGVLFGKYRWRARNWTNKMVLRSDWTTAAGHIVGAKIMEPRCGQASENHVIGTFCDADDVQSWGYFLFQSPTHNVPETNYFAVAARWVTGTNYVVGNYVAYGNFAYRCILNHTSGTILPTNATYWVAYSNLRSSITPNGILNSDQSLLWTEMQYICGQETTPGVSGDAYCKQWVGPPGGGAVALSFDSTASQPGPTWPLVSIPLSGAFNMLASTSTKGWLGLTFNQTFGGGGSTYYNNGPAQQCFQGLDYLYASVK